MTKQEKIWQGVASIIYCTDEPLSKVNNILQYLHSKGVRIVKVVPGVYPLIEPLIGDK